jgi:thioredoxin 1
VPASEAGWWAKEVPPNMRHIASAQELVDELAAAARADELVVVDFFAPWCGACRTLFPKLKQIAGAHPDVRFLAVNFEESKALARGLGVKVLPFFHFYRGAEGRVDAFAASLSKAAKLRDAIESHKSARCFLEEAPAAPLAEFPDVTAGGGGGSGSGEGVGEPELVA